ncbi:MAG: Holliday junction resolvase RuvX [Bacteroidales bacterium]
MSRVMAIDYGKVRTGLAVTDVLRISANRLETVETFRLFKFLKTYFSAEEVGAVVVGYPYEENFSASENAERVEKFIEKFKNEFPDKDLILQDERYTSRMAQRTIIEAGAKKAMRRDKGLVDGVSATIILQSYLDSVY